MIDATSVVAADDAIFQFGTTQRLARRSCGDAELGSKGLLVEADARASSPDRIIARTMR
jgi:hypothetical protein